MLLVIFRILCTELMLIYSQHYRKITLRVNKAGQHANLIYKTCPKEVLLLAKVLF